MIRLCHTVEEGAQNNSGRIVVSSCSCLTCTSLGLRLLEQKAVTAEQLRDARLFEHFMMETGMEREDEGWDGGSGR